jgi:hypothetical protein
MHAPGANPTLHALQLLLQVHVRPRVRLRAGVLRQGLKRNFAMSTWQRTRSADVIWATDINNQRGANV